MPVLIAYDASEGARLAVELVASAWPRGSKVRLVAAADPVPFAVASARPIAVPQPPTVELFEAAKAHLAESLETASERLREAGLEVEAAVLDGRPSTVITDEADRIGAEVVVVGSRGHGRLASLVLGSVSSEIVDHATQPVLVARAGTLSKVVLATDGSPSAAVVEQLLATWPVFEATPIRVLSVAEVVEAWRTGIAPTMYAQAVASYQRDLEEARGRHERLANDAAERLRAAGRDATAEVRTGDPASEIVAAAEAWGADLVVMGSRGNTGVKRLVLGSVARDVVLAGAASVLVAKARAAEEADDASS